MVFRACLFVAVLLAGTAPAAERLSHASGVADSRSLAQSRPLTLDQLRLARRQLAHRPRRIIANNDGCDCLYFPRDEEPSVTSFLAKRTTGLAGTHVDSIAYCTISAGFSNFTHRTAAGTLLSGSASEFGIQPSKRNIAGDLIAQGADCLEAVGSFCHENNMEVFWSMRMNDTHDAAHRPETPYFLFPPLKYKHPEWLVGDPVKRTPFGRWSSVDYARAEIRELAYRYVEEVCRGYDVDGIELDYFRHLCYFKNTAMGGKADDAQRAAMTELVRRIRSMTEEVGMKRGRPILLAIRATDSAEYNRDMGLDVDQWLKEGLFDMLITTCYFRLNPWKYSVEWGHRYGVPVYPCLSDSRVIGETRFRRSSPESYRGRAINAWAAGADGIHVFNLFDPQSPVFREVGDRRLLNSLDRLYFVTVRDGNPGTYLAGGEKYRTVPQLTPSHPAMVTPSKQLAIDLETGEDFSHLSPAALPTVMLHLEVAGLSRPDAAVVKFGGQALRGVEMRQGWLDVPVPPALVRQGTNRVELSVGALPRSADAPWSLTYEGSGLPSRPWQRDHGSSATEVSLVDGALRIADRGTAGGDYVYYRLPWGAEPDSPIAVEAQVKVVSGTSYLIVSDGVAQERIGLAPNGIDLWSNHRLRYAMDTTDAFHTYRIETEAKNLRVYVDDVLRLDGRGTWKSGKAATGSFLAFGATNSPGTGEALWKSVRTRTYGFACSDVVMSVRPVRPNTRRGGLSLHSQR